MAADHRELFRQAVAAHRQGEFPGAVEICDSILSQTGDEPEVLNLKAIALAEGGSLVLAREAILSALESTDTGSPVEMRALLHVHAARILAALDLYGDALEHARQAAELRPGDPGCAYQFARLALLAGNVDLARELVKDCLERFPGFLEARMLGCQMAMEAGDLESAEAALEAVIEQEPFHARALSGLAAIRKPLPAEGETIDALMTVHESGPVSGVDTGDWATATFALADSHARAGAYHEAFALYREANSKLASRSAWDMKSWETRVNATLKASALRRPVTGTVDGPQPLFIVGMPRSGSSLLERILGAHPRISMGGERGSLLHIERHLGDSGILQPAAGAGVSDEIAGRMAAHYKMGMNTAAGAVWVTDKANRNFERLGLAMRLFPASRALWILRHPLDTILSCFFKDFQHGLGFTHSLSDLTTMYQMHLRLMEKWIQCFGESICLVPYAQLVQDTEVEVRRTTEFLGLDFHPDMLEPHRARVPVRTASTLQVQEPIHSRRLGRWRNYDAELAEIIDELQRNGILDADGEAAALRSDLAS